MAAQLGEQVADLVCCKYLDFLRLYLWRTDHAGDIAADDFTLDGARKSGMQDAVGVADGPCRQRVPILAP